MKPLKDRQADREQRKVDAQAQAKESAAIVATGTLAEQAGKVVGATDSEEEEEEEESYASWTVQDLKTELDNREIEYKSDAKKADLVALLEEDDQGA